MKIKSFGTEATKADGLVDVMYHWHAETPDDYGEQEIRIDLYETSNNKLLDMKTIQHCRI